VIAYRPHPEPLCPGRRGTRVSAHELNAVVGWEQVTAAAAQDCASGVGGGEKAREGGATLQEQLSGGGAIHAALVGRTAAALFPPACSAIALQRKSVPLARSDPRNLDLAQEHRAAGRMCARPVSHEAEHPCLLAGSRATRRLSPCERATSRGVLLVVLMLGMAGCGEGEGAGAGASDAPNASDVEAGSDTSLSLAMWRRQRCAGHQGRESLLNL